VVVTVAGSDGRMCPVACNYLNTLNQKTNLRRQESGRPTAAIFAQLLTVASLRTLDRHFALHQETLNFQKHRQ
jgi:hypothetical protein